MKRRKQIRGVIDMDRHVGERVRLRRNMLGWSQEKLGEKIGLTFQQVQKYERGSNRISASKLVMISRALDVPIAFFYDDRDPAYAPPVVDQPDPTDALNRADSQALLAAYRRLGSDKLQLVCRELLRALVAAEQTRTAPPVRKRTRVA
jgi:transcriptional regulator with XRE-family HTH domain